MLYIYTHTVHITSGLYIQDLKSIVHLLYNDHFVILDELRKQL